MSRNAQQKPNIFSTDYMPVMALISRDWEIIVLFSMYRHAQSCAFISVIELPRIPTYCPKKAITFYKLLFAIFSRFSLLFWHKNHVLCILNYLDLYPLSLQPQSDQAESRRETLQSINISLIFLTAVIPSINFIWISIKIKGSQIPGNRHRKHINQHTDQTCSGL